MKIIPILITVFLLAAFAIGISVADEDMDVLNVVLTNATITASNFSLSNMSENAYVDGGFRVMEKGVHFGITAGVEIMRAGILFGHDNPDYFTPEFIIGIARLLIWAMVISMLFVPLMYLLATLIVIIMWVAAKFKERRIKKNGYKTIRTEP